MLTEVQEQQIYNLANQVAQVQNLELVEVKIGIHQKDILIQVLADRPEGGIGIEECTLLNRSIVEAIDKGAFLSEDGYSLEVSSPGLDRPLVTSKDFLRNIDAEVTVLLKEKVADKGEHTGIIKSVTENQLILSIVNKKEQKEISIPLDRIFKGLLVL